MQRTVQVDDFRVELDLANQVLRVSLPHEVSFQEKEETDPPLAPTPTRAAGFVSASLLAQKAKLFDDGLLAGVELVAQSGAGKFQGKRALLRNLLRTLLARNPSPSRPLSILLGAARLGELGVDTPAHFEPEVNELVEGFLAAPVLSKPIGFYGWTEELSRIFQQDRLLQQPLEDPACIEEIARALHEDASTRAVYERCLELVSRLTNPLVENQPDLRVLLQALDRGEAVTAEGDFRFVPPSRAHETDLAKKLYGNRPIPDGFDLVEEMVRRIRSRKLSLEPGPDSGWYDYQTWALEPLVVPERMPEASKLQIDPEYRKQLLELFRGILALTRETHIKQLEIPFVGTGMGWGRTLLVEPQLSVEPTLSHYLRRAVSYRFVGSVLEAFFGDEGLEAIRRLGPDGAASSSLADELRRQIALFSGASVVLAKELGIPAEGTDADAEAFLAWARGGDDRDLSRDVRMMVPVFFDVARKQTKVWVFLGWSSRRADVDFAERPGYRVLDRKNRDVTSRVEIEWGTRSVELDYPVSAELYVGRLLNRDEFRRHCDRHRTRKAILASLS